MAEQTTTRSISQILHRHGPGSLVYIDEHSIIGRVSTLRADIDTDVNRRRLHRRFVDRMRLWLDNGGKVPGITDADRITERDIVALRPRQVEWVPYGEWYACRNRSCGVMHKNTDADFDGHCRLCRGPLDQLPYVYYHHCGSFAELQPQARCPNPSHQGRYIAFYDTNDLSTSAWVCRGKDCKFRKTAFYPPCNMPACKAQPGDHKRYQISHWRDQWVYYAQNVDFVNLDDGQALPFLNSTFGQDLIHEAVLGAVPTGHRNLENTLKNAGGNCPQCGFKVTPGWNLCPACGHKLASPTPSANRIPLDIDDGRVTWAMLRDLEESRSISDEALKLAGKINATTRGHGAMTRQGIHDIVLVNAFPLTTGLMGYTRSRSDNQAWLRIFKRHDDKHVVYTDSVGTEAWLVQLSAKAVVEWLRINQIDAVDGSLPTAGDENTLKTWLIEKLVLGDENIVAAVLPLLHTFSHVLLYSLAIACGLEPSSLGEMIMLDALGFAIYAGDSELGALTAAFDQMLDVVMDGFDDYNSCKFDPGCRDDDKGACVGCIHMPRGCERFNEVLSRAFLFGGPAPASPILPADLRGFLGVAATI